MGKGKTAGQMQRRVFFMEKAHIVENDTINR
jgi:hypothetical protein